MWQPDQRARDYPGRSSTSRSTLVVAEHVIEEPGLPYRCSARFSINHDGERAAFQARDPLRELELSAATNEKMNVIRHDDVAPHGNVELVGRALAIGNERGV